ncbi:protein zntB-like [Schistocerca gregaria]|uniref:protein zntB-like n=1 Tax=Schistocerca gregaria TaxID=7010 RepID=UPI00211DB841|nr:protein zntB-like [Schistocerca gregaria]
MGYLLSFNAGVMLYVSFVDILPEIIHKAGLKSANLGFFAGFFLILVASLVPNWGATDDNHIAHDEKRHLESTSQKNFNRMGVLTAFAISLHNLPEGIATYIASIRSLDTSLLILVSIGLHNIPEGVIVASPIYLATRSKWKAFKYALISGLCESLTAIIVCLSFPSLINSQYNLYLMAAAAGAMVCVSVQELIPQALQCCSKVKFVYLFSLGMLFASSAVCFLPQAS